MEAICYVAEMKSIPSNEEMRLAEATSVVDYFDKMELGECDINGNNITIEPPPFISAPKARSLHDRLAKLLRLFYGRLSESGSIRRQSTTQSQAVAGAFTKLINQQAEVARKRSTAETTDLFAGMLSEATEAGAEDRLHDRLMNIGNNAGGGAPA
jgi:hypothetical protein